VKVRITAGEVDIRLDGHDLTHRQLRDLIRQTVSAAVALNLTVKPDEPEPQPTSSLGFTAHLDLDTGRHDPPAPPWYDDEDEDP
jgi:hypothetical protein